MNLEWERELLAAMRVVMWWWLVVGTLCLVAGSLTNKSLYWLVPMGMAWIGVLAEWRQEIRVRNLEKRQQ